MTGSRAAAVPGIHIASCTASLAVARALGSFAAAASCTARCATWVTSAPGSAVRSVPEGAGQGREHPGPQGQRAARLFQPPRGLAEQVEQLGVLRSRPVPERLDAQRRPRQPNRVPGGPAGVGGLTEPLRGQVGAPGALVRRGELEQDLDAFAGSSPDVPRSR